MNEPIIVIEDNFQKAWLEVVKCLRNSHWDINNLIVQIKNPKDLDSNFHRKVISFASKQKLLNPKHVAYTIFPHNLYTGSTPLQHLFNSYNRHGGLYERLQKLKRGQWGTYFRRITNYDKAGIVVNQLDNVIKAINNRQNINRAAYTIIIPNPGGETIRPLGGPCLNYLAVQCEPGCPKKVGLLAVYRNHDFLKRAYGNYWGLCNLLKCIASEVTAEVGPLTCISSHAYVSQKKSNLKNFVMTL